MEGLAETAYKEFGRVDVLVNNAGMSPLYDRIENVTEELWDKVLDVNLKGPFRLTAMVGARMAAGAGGSIIMVSSTSAIRPTANVIPYAAAKAAVNAMTGGFAHAFGPKVRVNCIMPGPFLTDISKAWDLEAFRERARTTMALGRGGTRGDRRRRALLRLGRVELHDRRGARHPRRGRLTRSPAADAAPAEVAPVRPGEQLDWAALEAWLTPRLAEMLPAARGPLEILQFPNGSANLTYLSGWAATSWCCGGLLSASSRPAPTT